MIRAESGPSLEINQPPTFQACGVRRTPWKFTQADACADYAATTHPHIPLSCIDSFVHGLLMVGTPATEDVHFDPQVCIIAHEELDMRTLFMFGHMIRLMLWTIRGPPFCLSRIGSGGEDRSSSN